MVPVYPTVQISFLTATYMENAGKQDTCLVSWDERAKPRYCMASVPCFADSEWTQRCQFPDLPLFSGAMPGQRCPF
jgi:hypothetical protein